MTITLLLHISVLFRTQIPSKMYVQYNATKVNEVFTVGSQSFVRVQVREIITNLLVRAVVLSSLFLASHLCFAGIYSSQSALQMSALIMNVKLLYIMNNSQRLQSID